MHKMSQPGSSARSQDDRPELLSEERVSTAPSSDIFKVGVRVPPFWPEEPEIWFSQIEGQFAIAGITSDVTKFHYVISQLDRQFSKEVKDIITQPPASNKYGKIKDELIKRLGDSSEKKSQQLLMHEELGDRKPSQFLRHLQDLAGKQVTEEFLRTMWISRLPWNIQSVLAAQPNAELSLLADLADRIHAVVKSTPQVASTSQAPGSSLDAVMNEIAELRKQVQALTTQGSRPSRAHSRGRSKSRKPSRSNTRSQSSYRKYPTCWYHARHGVNANKCVKPCDFGKSGNATGSL